MNNTTINKQSKQQLKTTGINQQKLQTFSRELAKDIHTQDDISKLVLHL